MIRFDEVKRTKKETCVFVASKWEREIEYCLRECGIPYEKINGIEMKERFPNVEAPETVPFSNRKDSETKNMCIFVTNLDEKGFMKKYKELMKREDPDVRAFRKACSLAGLREYEEMEQMRREAEGAGKKKK